MKTHSITTYTLPELKAQFPDAYAKAFMTYKNKAAQWESPWASETFDSLKAVFETAGLRLTDWNLSTWGQTSLRFTLPEEVGAFTGKRAFAWLENNLFFKLRAPFSKPATRYKAEKSHGTKKPYALAGFNRSCPLTGYCADECYLEALTLCIRKGYTVKDAFEDLASVWVKLTEEEEKNQVGEEAFEAYADGLEFTEEGEEF